MPTIITARRRAAQMRKPRWRYTIDWSQPTTRGLRHALMPQVWLPHQLFDVVTGGRTDVEPTTFLTHTTHGLGLSTDRTTGASGVLFPATHFNISASPVSFSFWYSSYDYLGSGGHVLSCGPKDDFDLYVQSANHRLWIDDANTGWIDVLDSRVQYKLHHAVLTWGNRTGSHLAHLYVDGQLAGTGGNWNAAIANLTYFRIGGRYNGQTGADTTTVGLSWYDRELTASDVRTLYSPRTRWSMFEEYGRRSYFIVGAAPAPGNPSKVGNQDVVKKYVGDTEVVAEYVGDTKIWPLP